MSRYRTTRHRTKKGMAALALLACGVLLLAAASARADDDSDSDGLSAQAFQELAASGVNKYLGSFTPISSQDVGGGWVKHTFNPNFGPTGPNGPVCIAGTPYSVFTNAGEDDEKLLIMLQGGGACWQGFYFCNILAEAQEPPPPPVGIWDFASEDNPFRDHSIVYLPYCDGSVFGGDNDVFDPGFPFGSFRFHRGLRNLSAGMDVAQAVFPDADEVTVAGSSAGGVGAAAFAPFLARFQYGNDAELTVFNDAGPIAVNLFDVGAVAARAADWDFGKFFPASCTACSATGQQTAIIDWRLDNDGAVRESFYETDADGTNRFFTSTPTQALYRGLILTEHGALNAAFPNRYKRFIVSGDASHTALQSPLFYSQDANGVLLNEWTEDFLENDDDSDGWVDIVEDFIPFP